MILSTPSERADIYNELPPSSLLLRKRSSDNEKDDIMVGPNITATRPVLSTLKKRTPEDERKRNAALKRAIAFTKVPLLANTIYFTWRWISIARSIPYASHAKLAAYISFLLVEWIFGGKLSACKS